MFLLPLHYYNRQFLLLCSIYKQASSYNGIAAEKENCKNCQDDKKKPGNSSSKAHQQWQYTKQSKFFLDKTFRIALFEKQRDQFTPKHSTKLVIITRESLCKSL